MNDDTEQARAKGRAIGYMENGQVRDCVYPHKDTDLRRVWLEGFSEGRVQRRKEVGLTPSGVDPKIS